MLPERVIDVKSEGGTVSIMGKKEAAFNLVATTVLSSIEPGHNTSTEAIMFRPEKDVNGLVAVRALYTIGRQSGSAGFFLPIVWKDGKPDIDVKKIWLPSGRLGQINHDCIETVIAGERFTSKKEGTAINGKRFVPDPNLLLSYIFNEIPDEAVIDAAQDAVCEADALAEVAELRMKLKEALNANLGAERELQIALIEGEIYHKKYVNLLGENEKAISDLKSDLAEIQKELSRVSDERTEYLGKYVDVSKKHAEVTKKGEKLRSHAVKVKASIEGIRSNFNSAFFHRLDSLVAIRPFLESIESDITAAGTLGLFKE